VNSKRQLRLLKGAFVVLVLGVIVLGADSLFAWTPESGGGGGGGGNRGKSSVPAPFGLLFMGFATTTSAFFFRQVSRLHKTPILLFFSLLIASGLGLLSHNVALLFAVPILALALKSIEKQPLFAIRNIVSLFIPVTAAAFASELLPAAFFASIGLTLWHADISRKDKILLGLTALLALCCTPPFLHQADAGLQAIFAGFAVAGLNLLGFEAFQSGNVIEGLAISIHVTKACVGMAICANLVALSAFLTVMFGEPKKQGRLFLMLTGVGIGLNLGRIILISGVGHLSLSAHLNQFHDTLGWFVAFGTYALMGILTFYARKSKA